MLPITLVLIPAVSVASTRPLTLMPFNACMFARATVTATGDMLFCPEFSSLTLEEQELIISAATGKRKIKELLRNFMVIFKSY